MSPLITIITPCFDDGATLPMALASLVAQTVQDWECIVVDDGSGEAVAPIVEELGDERVSHLAFAENRGRSVARQAALERARGEYICMLDADDWYGPDKLERQLTVLRTLPELVAVGMGMFVIDEHGELQGVRSFAEETLEVHIGREHEFPATAFPPVMLRREAALSARFDPALKRSEDFDYLMRVLAGKSYGVLAEAGYVYREIYSDYSMGEALSAFRFQRQLFRSRMGQAAVKAGRGYLWTLVKTGVYGAARAVGRGEWLFTRRNRAATAEERRVFEAWREVVLGRGDA